MKKLLLFFMCTSFVQAQDIVLEIFATGFTSPVAIQHAGDDRLFVVERGGNIKILNSDGTVNPTSFLQLNNTVIVAGGERGLLGLAFHPDYENNGYFFVNYTRAGDGATNIVRYSVNPDNPDVALPASDTVLLTVPQTFTNHNGGSLAFGPDGYLYIGMGDGGDLLFVQDMNSLLGKMLRIDVDNTDDLPYSIPADNPFVGVDGADEIWAVGLRNPWKFSFNRLNGNLWIADVGQSAMEEINKVSAPLEAGLNFGWSCYEGNNPHNTSGCLPASAYTFPISTYPLGNGFCAITGGYEYTGSLYPNFTGKYFFADYCASRIGWIDQDGGTVTWTQGFSGGFATLGEDFQGELYVAGINSGVVHKITDASLSVDAFEALGLKLYPNPASSEVNLVCNHACDFTTVRIFDLSGKYLFKQDFDSQSHLVFSVDGLKTGMYVLEIQKTDGTLLKTKFVKE